MTELHLGDRVTISFTVTGVDDDEDYQIEPDFTEPTGASVMIRQLSGGRWYLPSYSDIPEECIVRAARRPKAGDRFGGSLRYLACHAGVHYLITETGLPFRVDAGSCTARFADGSLIDWTVE